MSPNCFDFSKYENHSSWLVIWFDTSESTYHTLFEVVFFIEFALCFITKVGPFLVLDPSILQRSAIAANSHVQFRQTWICSNHALLPTLALFVALSTTVPSFLLLSVVTIVYRSTSSSTAMGLICLPVHNPTIGLHVPFRHLLAGFPHLLDSPCCWNHLCAFFLALVGCHHCVPIHLVLYSHGADLPPCT